ncbi:hypothetical protein Daus18300_001231 [Diaporthe australafricana]|uniref:Store-operated calcium entry-associated regulatory factor n=1 Tax=Diaporthe australafricana TaxID=127596 RepID=A0ABR3XY55_9PEZI
MHALSCLLATLALLGGSVDAKPKPRDAILLSQVESLTLRADRETTHRRAPAVPQLKCVSSRAICAKYKIDTLRCENKGSGYDSEDIQWSCSASLPPELKLGSTDVICEGYSSPDDPYVLKGSCGVEYRMALTREGEEKWPDLGGGSDWRGDDGGSGLMGYVFWVIFFAVLAFIVYNGFINARANGGNGPRPRQNNGGNFWGGGGGGGGGGNDDWGNDDPPPPYPGTNNSNNRGKTRRSGGNSAQRGGNAQQGWRPDFWSAAGGAAAGAAAGYGAGRMGRNNDTRGSGAGYGGGDYGSTWGSGGAGSSRSGSSGSSSGSGVSSSRHESTGFGSTSRR